MKLKLLYLAISLLCAGNLQAFYNPEIGRWVNRDPIGEADGINMYCFVGNEPMSRIDKNGRITFKHCPPSAQAKIKKALKDACDRIDDQDKFSCCMGSGAGAKHASYLQKLCKSTDFKVICEPEDQGPWATCGVGDHKSMSITLYFCFFKENGGGWGRDCVMAHEMLHLSGITHPLKGPDPFTTLHKCLGCPPYP